MNGWGMNDWGRWTTDSLPFQCLCVKNHLLTFASLLFVFSGTSVV